MHYTTRYIALYLSHPFFSTPCPPPVSPPTSPSHPPTCHPGHDPLQQAQRHGPQDPPHHVALLCHAQRAHEHGEHLRLLLSHVAAQGTGEGLGHRSQVADEGGNLWLRGREREREYACGCVGGCGRARVCPCGVSAVAVLRVCVRLKVDRNSTRSKRGQRPVKAQTAPSQDRIQS